MARIFTPSVKPPIWNFDRWKVDPYWNYFWDHALAVYPFWESGGSIRDLVTGEDFALTTGWSWADMPFGRVLRSDGTGNLTISKVSYMPTAGPLSVVWVGTMSELDGNTEILRITSAAILKWQQTNTTGVVGITTTGEHGTADKLAMNALGERTVLSYNADPSDQVRMWLDGVSDDITINGNFGANSSGIRLSPGGEAVDNAALYVLDAEMPEDMHVRLARDPFGPLRPARRRAYRAPVVVTNTGEVNTIYQLAVG